MRGEFCALFYVIREQLYAAATRTELAAVETMLAAHEPELAQREFNRLKLLVARRWKAFG